MAIKVSDTGMDLCNSIDDIIITAEQLIRHKPVVFEMLDKPEQLSPNSKMPCLVRMIQDDSQMGKYNKDMKCWDTIGCMTWEANVIKNNPLYNNKPHAYEYRDGGYLCIGSIHQLEIIGYPANEKPKPLLADAKRRK